jgi:hypothetical protein
VSSDQLHPADFLAELASAIKAVRERGGKWNKTADTIQWANDRIVRLEAKLDFTEKAFAAARQVAHEYEDKLCALSTWVENHHGTDVEDLLAKLMEPKK